MSAIPMMTLGPVVFHLKTAAFQTLNRSTEYRWASQDRLGLYGIPFSGGPSHQYVSPGNDTISLDGVIYPTQMGNGNTMSLLRLAAMQGIPWPLVQYAGSKGIVLGFWIIERIDENQSIFAPGGEPRKIDFKLSLKYFK